MPYTVNGYRFVAMRQFGEGRDSSTVLVRVYDTDARRAGTGDVEAYAKRLRDGAWEIRRSVHRVTRTDESATRTADATLAAACDDIRAKSDANDAVFLRQIAEA